MQKISCIVLCAGEGTRMGEGPVHKVCCPIRGRPAVLRALDCYKEYGLDPIVVVVGSKAENVMETVAEEYPEAMFAFQPRRLGTGNAVRYGYELLKKIDKSPKVPVLITMGDKLISQAAIEQLIESYRQSKAALAFCTAPRSEWASGRVAKDEQGELIGIFERQDIRRAMFINRLLDLCRTGDPITTAVIRELFQNLKLGSAAARLLPVDFINLVHEETELQPGTIQQFFVDSDRLVPSGNRFFDTQMIESSSPQLNVSLYLIGRKAFEYGLERLKPSNPQGEEYFTDLVNQLMFRYRERRVAAYRVLDVPLPDSRLVVSFNNREQLLEIESLLENQSGGLDDNPEARQRKSPTGKFPSYAK